MIKFIKNYFLDSAFSKKRDFLKSLHLFKDLSPRDIGVVLQALHSRVYENEEEIFAQGDIGRALMILETGQVKLIRKGPHEKSQLLATLNAGDVFGEMALLEHLPRSASAIATQKSHVYLLYRTKLEEILHHHPRVGVAILRHLSQLLSARLRRTLEDLGSSPKTSHEF